MVRRSTQGAPEALPYVAYVRVSTTEQADSGLGLAAQRSAIQQACEARGLPLGTIFEDAASGSSMAGREGLALALSEIVEGRACGLIVSKLDRLARSVFDFAGLLDRSRREGWSLIALDLGVDPTTPAGELMATVMSSMAQYERRLIGQRTKDALAELKAQGRKLGRPSAVDPALVDRIERMRSDGVTLQAIADTLTDESVPTSTGKLTWYPSTVRYLLASRSSQNPTT